MITLFVNRLTNLDFSFLDPVRGLVGQSWLLDVELQGSLDRQGMVLDFGEVKRQIKRTVDRYYDHRLLVPADYPGCRIERNDRQRCEIRFELADQLFIEHRAPADATALIPAGVISPESVTEAIEHRIRPMLPGNVRRLGLRLYPEQIQGACYHYSHGLKQHAGNCQRIAHGHRSRIIIFRNQARDRVLEQQWAARWRDIYLATKTDLREELQLAGNTYCRFGYTAQQGSFELTLPQRRCYLIDQESTVENLARHISHRLALEHPDSAFRVTAFEGIDKGAVGIAPA